MVSYTCRHELLPMIEAALAAHGYVPEPSLSKPINSSSLMMMAAYNSGGVLLTHNQTSELAEINIWGAAQSAASTLLESLPLPLEKRSIAVLVER
jgi:hypothetical protein